MAAAASQRQNPGTPRVISPSPTPSDTSLASKNSYFPPTTRSAARQTSSPSLIDEEDVDEKQYSDTEVQATLRSRSKDRPLRRRRLSGLSTLDGESQPSKKAHRKTPSLALANGNANGHLSPTSAARQDQRDSSRSSSPLGLIPIHQKWRTFVHKHEVPRKLFHSSIGFLTLGLYAAGYQTTSIAPVLMSLFVPIAFTDLLRHNHPPFNQFYIRTLGALMRESEAHDKYNGVIWYLLGAWTALRFFPKDIGVVSVLLLSWCDPAASTFGRMLGSYTPRIRKGKSLAGSLAACAMGVTTALFFWGWFAPRYEMLGVADNTGENAFAFRGWLSVPTRVSYLLGLNAAESTIGGGVALGVMSLWAGLVGSASEAVDLFGWDDNFSIPLLCGVGLWGFLKTFGSI